MRLGPVTFLFLVAGSWATMRAVVLWPEGQIEPAAPKIAWAPPLLQEERPVSASKAIERRDTFTPVRFKRGREAVRAASQRFSTPLETNGEAGRGLPQSYVSPMPDERDRLLPIAPMMPAGSGASRFSLSAWAILRGDVSPGLASAGQLGGSQAGVRARLRLSQAMHLAARISGPLSANSGKEAAVALDLQPIRNLPVTFTIERRLGLDRGGRDAFGLGAFGGFDRMLTPRLRLDGYAQAGLVGLRSRDAYVDGAFRVERTLFQSGEVSVGAGAGLWGGAQPGAARVDAGPQLVARLPLGPRRVRLAAEWRQRVAGDARPGSGPALTLGADF